ncbi:YtxH domain-containing protein [Hymenobacter wooponensis]|uniref:YtxH domain-containing protein n=1 Tax=Hymenobacter wooponensis TaxID=1525360 RepID=A0A4Z0MUU9_9BACT|nr:YtxH domain-containing protein [Hymenobacter wooponensis]TGD82905.1 YtxH domain-containing protein [Hymenobacter wooponensis]
MQDTKGKVILSLLAGATAGIVAGLLLAPETGDETRSGLKKSASKLSDDLSKLLKEGLSRVNSLKSDAPVSDQQQADRSAADNLLSSLDRPSGPSISEAGFTHDGDSDYDGIGGDARHYPGSIH